MTQTLDKTYTIGIDLGGTKIHVVACDQNGQVLARARRDTKQWKGREAVIDRMVSMVEDLLADNDLPRRDLLGVGIGAPGLVDPDSGILYSSVMLPGWYDVPLAATLGGRLRTDIVVDNDANAAAYGEWWIGAGRGANTLVCLTIGTGIGGGLIINGQLYRGPDGTASEFGHMSIEYDGIECICGSRGCLGMLASGTAMARMAREAIESGRKTAMTSLVKGQIQHITGEIVAQAAEQGDPLAGEIVDQIARYLGIGIANLVNIFNPDKVVLSGGVAQIGDRLFNRVREEAEKRSFDVPFRRVQILPASLGLDAGAIGMAGILRMTLANV